MLRAPRAHRASMICSSRRVSLGSTIESTMLVCKTTIGVIWLARGAQRFRRGVAETQRNTVFSPRLCASASRSGRERGVALLEIGADLGVVRIEPEAGQLVRIFGEMVQFAVLRLRIVNQFPLGGADHFDRREF